MLPSLCICGFSGFWHHFQTALHTEGCPRISNMMLSLGMSPSSWDAVSALTPTALLLPAIVHIRVVFID